METQILLAGDLDLIEKGELGTLKKDIAAIEKMLKALIKSLENKPLDPFFQLNWRRTINIYDGCLKAFARGMELFTPGRKITELMHAIKEVIESTGLEICETGCVFAETVVITEDKPKYLQSFPQNFPKLLTFDNFLSEKMVS